MKCDLVGAGKGQQICAFFEAKASPLDRQWERTSIYEGNLNTKSSWNRLRSRRRVYVYNYSIKPIENGQFVEF